MTSVHDVAAYIINSTGNLSTMKLQKLCYYAQGWHLAWHGAPLFEEKLEAWQMGPVCRELYRYHKGKASVSEWKHGEAAEVDALAATTIDTVIDFYRPFSGFDLGRQTHSERPWLEAWEVAPFDQGRTTIDLDTMRSYFSTSMASSR